MAKSPVTIRRNTQYLIQASADVHATRIAGRVSPQPSPFLPDAVAAAERAGQWLDGLHRWIQQPPDGADRRTWHAAIVLSAILHGELVDSSKVKLLLQRLGQAPQAEACHGFDAITFHLPYQGLGNHHAQRWMLDPITAMLLPRCPDKGPALTFNELLNQIRKLLKKAGLADIHRPASMAELVRSAASRWIQHSASIELNGLRRTFATHAAADESWKRIQGLAENRLPHQTSDVDNSLAPELKEEIHDELLLLHPWLSDTERILDERETSNPIDASREVLGMVTDPLARTYVGWLYDLFLGNSASGDALQPVTIVRRYRLVTEGLLATAVTSDPATLDTSTLEDYYAELIADNEHSASLPELAAGLQDFHKFLVRDYGHDEIQNPKEVFGDGARKPVDGNLITYEEYSAATALLDRQWGRHWTQRDKRICRVVLMLAFKAGLRRMEIFGAWLDDFHSFLRMHVTVQPHGSRRLKTTNSVRVVPLFALLSREDKRLLKEWLDERARECRLEGVGSDGVRYLFKEFERIGIEDERTKVMSWVDKISRRVIAALRAVTGQRLYLHHLRHSCASWTYLRLRAAEFPMLADLFPLQPKTTAMIRSGRWLRRLLIPHAHRHITVREVAFVVSRILGHSSPAVSMVHYVHFADLVAGATVWRECARLPATVLVSASGLSQSAGYRHIAKGISALVAASRAAHASSQDDTPFVPPDLPAVTKNEGPVQPSEDDAAGLGYQQCYQILAMSMDHRHDEKSIASNLGGTVEQISKVLDVALNWGPWIGLEDANGRLGSLPATPKGATEKAYMERLEKQITALMLSDPAQCRDGLQLHMSHLNRQKFDVVFRGKKHADELKRYLRFAHALKLDSACCRWLIRKPDDGVIELPGWVGRIQYRWWPQQKSKQISPPTAKKSYSQWVGLQHLESSAPNADGIGKLFAAAVFLSYLRCRAS